MPEDKQEPDFPNLREMETKDREIHIRRAMEEAGMTREQAERHVDEDLEERKEHEGHR